MSNFLQSSKPHSLCSSLPLVRLKTHSLSGCPIFELNNFSRAETLTNKGFARNNFLGNK